MNRFKKAFFTPGCLAGTLISMIILVAEFAKQQYGKELEFLQSLQEVSVIIPENYPKLDQDSVDMAMTLFSIKKGNTVNAPIYDENLQDRGLTSSVSFSSHTNVTVGPAAFESWSILGSTLAHEVEVHGEQSFFVIWFLDLIGLEGTKNAERVAYNHEIKYAERFGLDSEMMASISETMDHYYPLHSKVEPRKGLAAYVKRFFSNTNTDAEF